MFLRQRKASSWWAGGQSREGETKKVCTSTTIYRHRFDTLVTLNILINTKWHFNNIEHTFINTKCVREMLSVNGNSLLTLSNFVDAKKFHKYINFYDMLLERRWWCGCLTSVLNFGMNWSLVLVLWHKTKYFYCYVNVLILFDQTYWFVTDTLLLSFMAVYWQFDMVH